MNKVHCDVCDKVDAKSERALHVHEEDVLAVIPKEAALPRRIVALKEYVPNLVGPEHHGNPTSDICDECLEIWLRALVHKFDRFAGVAP